jgi:alpha-galactosidase
MTFFQSTFYNFSVIGDLGPFTTTLSSNTIGPGLEDISLRLEAPRPCRPPAFALQWRHPSREIHATWTPSSGYGKGLRADWDQPYISRAASSAPVVCLHGQDGTNRLTFALSEIREPLKLTAGIHEETADFLCRVDFFAEPHPDMARYEVTLRVDTRSVAYYHVLRDVGEWWTFYSSPVRVPEEARLPMYSTWYSFHQKLIPSEVEKQCEFARQLGCESVIVDDGWQTLNSDRGYAYCGDWEPERIPEMRAHVQQVQQLGMKFLLWYSVPFVGNRSKVYQRLRDKVMGDPWPWNEGTYVLDPRFPEVREHLINIYVRALRDWNLDGFKLDFIDAFELGRNDVREATGGRDLASLSLAVDRLLKEAVARLREIKPDIMIEFRQSYVGPQMREYGNIFRASDCPNDGLRNRIKTIDVRLLSGGTAVHSDMLMWHPEDTVESAALQLLNVIFSVPQLSMALDVLPEAHLRMCRFWLTFWQQHRSVLLDGELAPSHPELLYPLVAAHQELEWIIALYSQNIVMLAENAVQIYIINATSFRTAYLDGPPARYAVEVWDCEGKLLSQMPEWELAGPSSIQVPPSGLVRLHRLMLVS